ncbi:MAG TPA: hypothetical protein DF383_13040, partial [Deltaproteobacteria bacterium]|nr:hypothetical protein [Deltaproteobacteria bacterium]
MQGIIELWRDMGTTVNVTNLLRNEDGEPLVTEEGVNSLVPLTKFYNHPSHPIELRALDDWFYKVLKIFK